MNDPVFKAISDMLNVPERPSQPPHLVYSAPKFDEHDDAMMHDILGNDRLAKPVQALLILASQADMTTDSFGLNAERFVRSVLPLLKNLRSACREEWEDQ